MGQWKALSLVDNHLLAQNAPWKLKEMGRKIKHHWEGEVSLHFLDFKELKRDTLQAL